MEYLGYLAATAQVFNETAGLDPALASLARMAVPALADACAIQVLDEFQNVESVTVARIDAESEGQVSVSQSRTPEGQTRPASHAALLMELASESTLVLPLASRGAVLGSIAFGLSHAGGFGPDQVQWAEDFARGVSQGVENVRLARMAERLEREREAAEAARARAEAARFEGEALVRLLVEHHQDRIWIFEVGPDRVYRLSMASPGLLAELGLAGKDWKDRPLEDLLPPRTIDFYRGMLDQVVEKGLPLELERESDADGKWGQTVATPIRDTAGRITHVLGSTRDVTRLKRAETAALARETELRLALQVGRVGLWDLDLATQDLSWSGYMHEIHGIAPEQAPRTRQEFFDRMHPEDREPFSAQLQACIEKDAFLQGEFRIVRPDGAVRWRYSAGSAIRDAAGKPIRFIGASADVTETRAALEALSAARRHLEERDAWMRLALQAGGIGTWRIDLSRGEVEISEEMRAILGLDPARSRYSVEERFRAVHPDDADRIREAQRRALMDGGPVELEYRYLRGGGEVQWVRCAMNAKVNPETGKPTHFLGLITDITERKRAELAIREAAERDAFRVSLADAVRNLGDPLEIQMAASRALGMRLGVLRAYYAEWEPDGETYLVRQDWRREGVPSIAGRYRVGDFGAWLLEDYQAGRSVFVADTETDPRIDAPMRAAYAAAGVRAWASAPLLKDGRLKAVFGVNHATPRAWTPDDIAMLEETAERAWAAVERAAAEAEAKRSHDLLRTVLGSLKDPLLVYDRGGKLAYANDAFARFLGYASAEEAMEGFDRARLADFAVYDAQGAEVAPERYSGARAWRGDFQQGETLRIVDRKTGAEHWMEVTTRPLFGADGEVERIIISSYDVTALKAAHAEARAGKELLDTALNALTDSLAILDPSGRILYLNEAAARFMGYASAAEVQGTTRDALEKRVEELDESGRSLEDSESGAVRVLRCVTESETRIVQLRSPVDGRIRWVESKAAAVKDEWGRLRYVVTTAVDITRLKAAQETVSAHADRLRLALEVGRVGVWELDMHSDQLNWSDRMCAMHGRLQGQPPRSQAEFLASIHPDDRPQVMAAFLEAGPRNHFEIEYRVPGRYGDVRWLYSAGGYHRGPDGKALRFMGATIEITARKRAEDAALRMQERVRKVKHMEAIGRMAGGMSHDFNNLLTAINGYADLILSAAREDRVLQSYASNIRESGERALRITQQLLAYSQKQLLETEVADANVIVRYMIDLIRKLVDESILILPALSPAPEPIRVDPGKLKQALLHVVMNALDAMPEGGRLSLSTFFTRLAEAMDANESVIPAGNYVVIEVADTGTGIAPEILGRIFDPYFTTKPLGVKSGLGLSMVQGIVKQHGGHIQVTSEKGVGTRFRMYFPPADGTSPHPPSA